MKAIMLSIKPEWVAKILNGEKTIEIRKTMPSCELPVKVYIYCTNGKMLYDMKNEEYWNSKRFAISDINSNKIVSSSVSFINRKVVAEFTLEEITDFRKMERLKRTGLILYKGAMDMGQYEKYNGRYAWHISNLKVYDKSKELSEFRTTPHCFNVKNIDFKENAFGEYIPQYYENSFCKVCKYYDHDWGDCNKGFKELKRPPQSWCYVEELEEKQ